MKSISRRAVNARVVKFVKAQRDKNGIARYVIAVSNFSCGISCYSSPF